MMKRISIFATVLLLLILVFFTFFGERIYEIINPHVKVVQVNASTTYNDEDYLKIPRKALTQDNCVYVIEIEQGFSRIIFSVQKKPVEYIEIPEFDHVSVYIISGISRGVMIISEVERDFKDGDRVIVD